MNPPIAPHESLTRYEQFEARVFYNDRSECRSDLPGPYVGDVWGGSFIVYVCDLDTGHGTEHYDSVADHAWSDVVEAPRLVTT